MANIKAVLFNDKRIANVQRYFSKLCDDDLDKSVLIQLCSHMPGFKEVVVRQISEKILV